MCLLVFAFDRTGFGVYAIKTHTQKNWGRVSNESMMLHSNSPLNSSVCEDAYVEGRRGVFFQGLNLLPGVSDSFSY